MFLFPNLPMGWSRLTKPWRDENLSEHKVKWLLTICSNKLKPLSKVFEALHQHLSDLLPHLVLKVKVKVAQLYPTSDSLQTHGLYSPWNSPGQNTGVGSRSLLQGSWGSPTFLSSPRLQWVGLSQPGFITPSSILSTALTRPGLGMMKASTYTF